ncbi:MAG: hypothetical protein ABIC91_00390 [Nanoarchaeota archaeon]
MFIDTDIPTYALKNIPSNCIIIASSQPLLSSLKSFEIIQPAAIRKQIKESGVNFISNKLENNSCVLFYDNSRCSLDCEFIKKDYALEKLFSLNHGNSEFVFYNITNLKS